jgi:pyruvate ferredoxin oxidoreductase alpha subunit
MRARLLTGNSAAAWGARLARADYIPAFPITPQTEIIEDLAAWIDRGEMDARMVTLESEHSMITAAGSAASSGVRVFTATSSQGLLYGMEMIYTVAGWRTPFVMVNVSRGLASPITLESDHNDIMAARDSGFLQIHCATCQEIADSVLIAYRLAEHADVRLPAIVNLDGFYLSFTREPVDLADASKAQAFVGEYDPENLQFRGNSPLSQAMAVLGGGPYSYFRYEAHLALQQALSVYQEVAAEFASIFGRHYPMLDCYCMDDAEYHVFSVLSRRRKSARCCRVAARWPLSTRIFRWAWAACCTVNSRPRFTAPLERRSWRAISGVWAGAISASRNSSLSPTSCDRRMRVAKHHRLECSTPTPN